MQELIMRLQTQIEEVKKAITTIGVSKKNKTENNHERSFQMKASFHVQIYWGEHSKA